MAQRGLVRTPATFTKMKNAKCNIHWTPPTLQMAQRGLVRTAATFTKMLTCKMQYSLNASNIANGTTRFSANASNFYKHAKHKHVIFIGRHQHCKWHNAV